MIITELKIKRSEWLTPDRLVPGDAGVLKASNGLKCCLGFVCEMVDDREIVGRGYPKAVFVEGELPQFVHVSLGKSLSESNTFVDTALTLQAALINDRQSISNSEREKLLTELFKENDITLTFVD